MNLLGCLVHVQLRHMLHSMVLVEQRDHMREIADGEHVMLSEERGLINVPHSSGNDQNKDHESINPVPSHAFSCRPVDWTPSHPLSKLVTQTNLFSRLDKKPAANDSTTLPWYTYHDANMHLSQESEVTWDYTSDTQKPDEWDRRGKDQK